MNNFRARGPAPTYSCANYGGGKKCCSETAGGKTMLFCTKESGYTGTPLP